MPRSSDATRRALLDAAERRFAADGITGATFTDITADAGQRNNSAVQYHFGDRTGLLEAVTARRVGQLRAARDGLIDQLPEAPTMRDLMRVIVQPLADMLEEPGGAAYLCIQADLLAHPARDELSPMLAEPWARPGLERVFERFGADFPAERADPPLRAILITTLIFHALADRSRTAAAEDHARFVEALIDAATAVAQLSGD